MRTTAAFLFALLLTGTVPAADDAAYFVPLRVPGNGAFVSLLPTNSVTCPHIWMPERLSEWKKFLGVAVGARFVIAHPDDERFPVQASDPALSDLLGSGQHGVSVVSLPNGDVWTNHLVIVSSAGESGTNAWVKLEKAPKLPLGHLNPGRGAGTNIWFVTWNELEARWKTRDRDQRLRDIRAIVSANPSAKAFLDERRLNRPDLWPAIVFANETSTNVTVSCGGLPETRLAPGERWTVELTSRPKADPDENGVYAIPWSYLEDGTTEDILKPLFGRPLLWNPLATSRVVMRLTPRPRRDRVLDLRDILPQDWADALPAAAGQFSVALGHGGVTQPLPANAEDPWLRDVPPDVNTDTDFVSISNSDFFLDVWFVPGPFTNRNDQSVLPLRHPLGRSRAPAVLSFRPWPVLTLTNTMDRVVTNFVTFLVDEWESATSTNVLDEGESAVIPAPAPDFAPFATSAVARVDSSAPWADPAVFEKPIRRGDDTQAISLSAADWPGWRPRPTPPWPDGKSLNDIPSTLFGVFAAESRARNIGYEPDASVQDVFEGPCGEAIGQILFHLSACPLRECPRCGPFRRALAEMGVSNPSSPDRVDIVLALCPEYLHAKRKRDPESEMQKARERLEPYRGQEPPTP